MSGGSQHPNGRQSQMGPGWSPLQLQMANLLARAPQAHMASERGVTWHTPTPPPHLYHVPVPSPPDPLQAMKGAAGNSVFRHTATPPELFRHTPTPPDKHLLRHTPSPGDVKAGGPVPPVDLYSHLGPGREKLRPEDLLAYARGGVDLSLGSRANGSPAHPPSPALSVRDAPTINSLIARAAPRHAHTRVDSLLERLVPSPHSVIVHSRAAPTPSPPSSNEDSADSCGAPPGSKRKRKPERTIRVPVPPAPSPPPVLVAPSSLHNGDTKPPQLLEAPANGPQPPTSTDTPPTVCTPDLPHARRKSRSGSAETIDDIAAMIANTNRKEPPEKPPEIIPPETPVSIDKLKSVLSSPDPAEKQENVEEIKKSPLPVEEKEKEPPASQPETSTVETAAAPKRRSTRTSNTESANVPVKSPSEAKPAEPETSDTKTAEPTAAFVEVENQLEKMFAGLEEEQSNNNEENKKVEETAKTEDSVPMEDKTNKTPETEPVQPKKRRKSGPPKGGDQKAARRSSRVSTAEETPRRKPGRKKMAAGKPKKAAKDSVKDAYDSGSNASSSRSRGPYVQIRGPRDSPVSVAVINAATGEDEEPTARRKPEEFRNGLKARGLHASTLGLRYDATTPDVTWLCAFCNRGPHANILGDLFGPYTVTMDCEEYRALDEATRRRYEDSTEVWFHESCGVWAPGLIAAGARLWGLPSAVWGARSSICGLCNSPGAAVACSARACRARIHLPCATTAKWTLHHDDFRAFCPRHA